MWNSITASLKYNVKLLMFYLCNKCKHVHLFNKTNNILGYTFA